MKELFRRIIVCFVLVAMLTSIPILVEAQGTQ